MADRRTHSLSLAVIIRNAALVLCCYQCENPSIDMRCSNFRGAQTLPLKQVAGLARAPAYFAGGGLGVAHPPSKFTVSCEVHTNADLSAVGDPSALPAPLSGIPQPHDHFEPVVCVMSIP